MKIRNHYLEDLCFEPLRLYFSFFLTMVVVCLGIRGLELSTFLKLSTDHTNLLKLSFEGLLFDIVFCLQLSAIFLPLFGLFHYFSYKNGKAMKLVTILLVSLIFAALTQYFIDATVPLGADFWGYSLKDIQTTINTSAKFDEYTVLMYLAAFAIPITLQWLLSKIEIRNQIVVGIFLLGMLGSLFVEKVIMPNKANYDSEQDFYIVENKGHYFLSRSVDLMLKNLVPTPTQNIADYTQNPYPFMQKMEYSDVIGPYLETNSTLPNIVIIQVEGLGKSFVGENAPKGGFTPYLDSLSKQSLHWDNFVSSAGRTFGVLPSIYGSLPFYKNGFMELGTNMPNHVSLISLLKTKGYRSGFFYGGNANFDNQDVFLEAQGIDLIVSEKSFPRNYVKMKPNSGGFTWGYGDKEVFKRYIEVKANMQSQPSLDIFMTLTTHEPFVVPEEKYHSIFDRIAKNSRIPKEILNSNRGVFECLLYTDDAIKDFIEAYKSRPDYKNTIFIVTGDHRMIPIPHESAIDRFHVPFIVWSPMLKKAEKFKGIGSHHQVAATLLAFLKEKYNLSFPDQLPFLNGVLDNSLTFRGTINQPIMRNKGDLSCYVMKEYYLSDDVLYSISDNLTLTRSGNSKAKKEITAKLDQFIYLNEFVCDSNKLYKGSNSVVNKISYQLDSAELKYLKNKDIVTLDIDERFYKARDLAFAGKYMESRIVLKSILNGSPNYSDVRILLGRTFSWEGQYEKARNELKEAIRRAPNYDDPYSAIIDCELYADRPDSAFYWYKEGLRNADDTTAIYKKKKSINNAKQLITN